MNNKINNSRDKIQPSEEAQARMLENILAYNQVKKVGIWKMIVPIAACFVISALVIIPFMHDNNNNGYTPAEPAIFLTQSTKGVNVSITREMIEFPATFNSLVFMTEDELINNRSNVIFEGIIRDAYNLKVTMAGKDEMYYGYAIIKVDDVMRGDLMMNEEGEVKVMLPCPIAGARYIPISGVLPDGSEYVGGKPIDNIPWVEDTDITSQFSVGQKGIFMVVAMDDKYDYREVYGEKFFYSDLANYRFADGVRCAFIETGDALFFDRNAYPTISNAIYLSEVREFILWKLGLGNEPQPLDDQRFQLKPNDDYENLPINYAQALEIAAKENGIKANENGKFPHRGVNPYLWTYGKSIFSEEALTANPELAKTGQPKDLPVYVVEFADIAVTSHGSDRTANKNLYVIVDANTGLVLMSYTGSSMYIR